MIEVNPIGLIVFSQNNLQNRLLIDRLLVGYFYNMRTVKAPDTGAQICAEVLLLDLDESFVFSDDFVALAVQLAAEDQAVERVRE